MHFDGNTIKWVRSGLSLVVGAGVVLGCRGVTPTQVASDVSRPVSIEAPQGTGMVNVQVELPKYELPEFKLDQGGARRVQHIDWTIATQARLSFYSADSMYKEGTTVRNTESWTQIGTLQGFVDTAGSMRRATFSAVPLPAGKRRVIKVDLLESATSPTVMHSLWGYGDITAGVTSTFRVTPYTTPAARVIRDLLAVGDPERAMTVSATQVQEAVDRLLDAQLDANFNLATSSDRNLDGVIKPVHPALLDTQRLTEAIIRGTPDASGVLVPYTVPQLPFPADLAVTPVRQATAVIKAIDSDGQPINTPSVVYLTDPVTGVQSTNSGVPVNQTFFPVATGNWRAAVVDTSTGRRIDAPLTPTLWHNETRELILAMPVTRTEVVLGTYNEPGRKASGYNGDQVHFSFFYADQPRHLVVQVLDNKKFVYFVDVNNKRICYLELDNPDAIVKTLIGGDGPYGSIKVTKDSDLVFDKHGDLYFTEPAASTVSKVDIAGTGTDPARPVTYATKTTVLDITTLGTSVWKAGDVVSNLAYDGNTDTLFVGSAENTTGGSLIGYNLVSTTASAIVPTPKLSSPGSPLVSTDPTLASSATPPYYVPYRLPFGGGGIVYHEAGGQRYLVYSGVSTVQENSGPRTMYSLVRHNLGDGKDTLLAGNPEFMHQDPFFGFQETVTYRYTAYAERFFQNKPYEHLTLDNKGNLYYYTHEPSAATHIQFNTMFRVTNALDSDRAAKPWLLSWIDLRPQLGYKNYTTTPLTDPKGSSALISAPLTDHLLGITLGPVDPVTGLNDIYCSGLHTVKNPIGSGSVAAHGVYKIKLK